MDFMKKVIIIAVLSLFAISINAQETPALDSVIQSNIRAEKKAMIANAIILTNEEAEVFWPLYEEYNNKMLEQRKEFFAMFEENKYKLESLSDHDAEKIWEKKMKSDRDAIKLEKKYFKKMLNKLPGAKVVRYFQAENKIKSMVDAQLAIEIPLINNPEQAK